jgi:hypothetical protein
VGDRHGGCAAGSPPVGRRGSPHRPVERAFARVAPCEWRPLDRVGRVARSTPEDIVAKLNAALIDALADAGVRSRLAEISQEIFSGEQRNPQALAALQRRKSINGGRSSSEPTSKRSAPSAAKLVVRRLQLNKWANGGFGSSVLTPPGSWAALPPASPARPVPPNSGRGRMTAGHSGFGCRMSSQRPHPVIGW